MNGLLARVSAGFEDYLSSSFVRTVFVRVEQLQLEGGGV